MALISFYLTSKGGSCLLLSPKLYKVELREGITAPRAHSPAPSSLTGTHQNSLLFASQKSIHLLHSLLMHLWQHMSIDVERSADVTISQYPLYHLCRTPHSELQRERVEPLSYLSSGSEGIGKEALNCVLKESLNGSVLPMII